MSKTHVITTTSPAQPEDETVPLLSPVALGAPVAPNEKNTAARDRQRRWIMTLLIVSIFIISAAACLEAAPQTAIFESIICSHYYDDQTSLEQIPLPAQLDCKVEPVQSKLALLSGWKDTLDQFASVFLAVPYGVMADRYGRKPVFILGLTGFALQAVAMRIIALFPQVFPVWCVFLTPSLLILGGGLRVVVSMLFTMLADISEISDRTKVFSYAMTLFLISQIFGFTGTAALMEITGLWPPYLGSIAGYCLGILLVCCSPETLNIFHPKKIEDITPTAIVENTLPATKQAFRNIESKLANARTFIKHNLSVCVLVACSFWCVLAQPVMSLLIIYIPRRFPPWTFAQASMLVSFRAFFFLVMLVAGIPLITYIFHRRLKIPQRTVDLHFAQLSALLVAIGLFIIGLAPRISLVLGGIVVFSSGAAVDILVRSLATTLVNPDNLASLFTSIAVVEGLGLICISPILASLFRWGMLIGERWQGLPFLFVGAFLLAAFFGLLFVRLPKNGEVEPVPEETTIEAVVQQEMHV